MCRLFELAARASFFADADPDAEIEMGVTEALRVLEKITAGLRDVMLPGSAPALLALRATVRAAEAYACHADFVEKNPEIRRRTWPACKGGSCGTDSLRNR
jgi:hypothetical protein